MTHDADLMDLTMRLRALRLPDEEMLLIDVGSCRMRDCGEAGSIRVTARKHGFTETVEALFLEDALLMVRAHLDGAIAAAKKAAADAKVSA